MADSILGLIFRVAAHPEQALEAMREFSQGASESMNHVDAHMKHTESVSKELTNFIKSHLIFSLDEFIRLGRDALDAAKSAAEFGEQIANLSEATGMSAEQVSALEFAFKMTGLNAEDLNSALRQMARNLSPLASSGAEGVKAMHSLGLAITDVHGRMKPEHELLLEISKAFQDMKNPTEKAAIATAIFGRRGQEMIPFLDRGPAGIRAIEEEAKKLGVTINNETAEKLRLMNEELKLDDARMLGLKLTISELLIPALGEMAGMLTGDKTSWYEFGEGVEEVIGYIGEGVLKLFGMVVPWIHRLTDVGVKDLNAWISHVQQRFNANKDSTEALLKTFEALKHSTHNLIPAFTGAGHQAKIFTDRLKDLDDQARQTLQDMGAESKPEQQILIAYDRRVAAATREINKDRELYREKKISRAELERAEKEYTDAVVHYAEIRDKKLEQVYEDEEKRSVEKLQESVKRSIEQQKRAEEQRQEMGRQGLKSITAGGVPDMSQAQIASMTALIQPSLQAAASISKVHYAMLSLGDAIRAQRVSVKDFADNALGSFVKLGDAMGTAITQAIIYGSSIGKAMKQATEATLEQLSAQAFAQSIYSIALGFLDLAEGDIPGADLAFTAAAEFAVIAGGAAIGAKALTGKSRGRGSYSAGGYGTGAGRGESYGGASGGSAGGSSGQQLAPGGNLPAAPKNANLTISIMGETEAGAWLANTLNTAVQQGGAQLTATRTTAIPNPTA